MSPGRIVFNYYRSIQLHEKIGVKQHTRGGGWYKTTLDSYGDSLSASPSPLQGTAQRVTLKPAQSVSLPAISPSGRIRPGLSIAGARSATFSKQTLW